MKKDGHTYRNIPKQEFKKTQVFRASGSKACMMKKLHKPKKDPVVNLYKKDIPKTEPAIAKNNSTTTASTSNGIPRMGRIYPH